MLLPSIIVNSCKISRRCNLEIIQLIQNLFRKIKKNYDNLAQDFKILFILFFYIKIFIRHAKTLLKS